MQVYENVIGKFVTYFGNDETWYGKSFEIIDQGKDKYTAKRIAFMVPGKSVPVWRTLGPSFSKPFDVLDDAAPKVDNPHQAAMEAIFDEVKRLEERIAELKLSLKVLNSF